MAGKSRKHQEHVCNFVVYKCNNQPIRLQHLLIGWVGRPMAVIFLSTTEQTQATAPCITILPPATWLVSRHFFRIFIHIFNVSATLEIPVGYEVPLTLIWNNKVKLVEWMRQQSQWTSEASASLKKLSKAELQAEIRVIFLVLYL